MVDTHLQFSSSHSTEIHHLWDKPFMMRDRHSNMEGTYHKIMTHNISDMVIIEDQTAIRIAGVTDVNNYGKNIVRSFIISFTNSN